MKKNTEKIREVADYVIQALLAEGVIIQRYDAYSTNSVYLKFDCGMANSLRIGDHKGKKHLNYMFKVDVNYSGPCKVEREKFTQYTYGSNKKQLDKLIKHILDHRERKIFANFGHEFYKDAIKNLYKNNKTQVGFWSQAIFINRIRRKDLLKNRIRRKDLLKNFEEQRAEVLQDRMENDWWDGYEL